MKFKSASAMKDFVHYSSYFLAAGIPLSLVAGSPITPLCDLAFGVIIPLHAHVGIRSVIIDYVWNVSTQRLALGALAGATAATVAGLTYFNLTDVGITEGVKELFVEQDPSA